MVSIALRDQLIKSIIIYFGEPCRESLSIDETRVSKQGKIRARTGSEKCDRLRWEPKKKAQPEPIGPTFSFMYFARSLWSLRSSNELGNTNTKFFGWPRSGGSNIGSQSCLSCSPQPHGPFSWDGTFSLRRTERCGIPGPSCGLCTFGLSMGAQRPPWKHSKHDHSG